MTICFLHDRPASTGLGDRFGVYLCVAALARISNSLCYSYWRNDAKSGPHRFYRWDIVRDAIRLPSNLRILDECSFRTLYDSQGLELRRIRYSGNELPSDEGYDCVYPLAHRALTFADSPVSQTDMENAYVQVSREWSIEMTNRSMTFPDPYVAVHLRGQDKRTQFLTLQNDFQTHHVLANIPDGLTIIAVTDDEELATYYLNRYPQALRLPDDLSSREENDLRSLGILMRAKAIVQHAENGWSAYSSVAAMARGIPLINTYTGPGFNRLELFRSQGGLPPELIPYTTESSERFIAHLWTLR